MTRKRQVTIHVHSRAGSEGWDTATYYMLNRTRAALVGRKEEDGLEHWYEVPKGSMVRCGPKFDVAEWDGEYWYSAFLSEDNVNVKKCLTDARIRKVPAFNSKDYRIIYGKVW